MVWKTWKRQLVSWCAVMAVTAPLTACTSWEELGALKGGRERLADGLHTIEPTWIDGLTVAEHSVSVDGTTITSKYPVVPGATDFTVDIRTTMAERETEFITQGGGGELTQHASSSSPRTECWVPG